MEKAGCQDNGRANLAWFVAGFGIGAAVAMLFAPRTGKQTREFISQKAHEGADFSREAYERGKHIVDDATELFDRARRLAQRSESVPPDDNL